MSSSFARDLFLIRSFLNLSKNHWYSFGIIICFFKFLCYVSVIYLEIKLKSTKTCCSRVFKFRELTYEILKKL